LGGAAAELELVQVTAPHTHTGVQTMAVIMPINPRIVIATSPESQPYSPSQDAAVKIPMGNEIPPARVRRIPAMVCVLPGWSIVLISDRAIGSSMETSSHNDFAESLSRHALMSLSDGFEGTTNIVDASLLLIFPSITVPSFL
jgi:hypothetical protein